MQVAAAPEAVMASRTGAGKRFVDGIGVGACLRGGSSREVYRCADGRSHWASGVAQGHVNK